MYDHPGSQSSVSLGSISLPALSDITFLGLHITDKGVFLPGRDDMTKPSWALWSRLAATGLHAYPRAWVKAYQVFVQPAAAYGCELWAAVQSIKMLQGTKSPMEGTL